MHHIIYLLAHTHNIPTHTYYMNTWKQNMYIAMKHLPAYYFVCKYAAVCVYIPRYATILFN